MKSNKGITMITLVTTITVILIITGTIVTQSVSNIHMRELKKLHNDLALLQDKISLYYII